MSRKWLLASPPYLTTFAKPILAFDMEGVKLGRNGETCYLQLRDFVNKTSYLIDLLALKHHAFTITAEDGHTTLKSILEDETLVMMIFDCRQDCDTLFHQYGVKTRGVLDLQIVKMLTRRFYSKYRIGCVDTMRQIVLSGKDKADWDKGRSFVFSKDYKHYHFKDKYEVFKLRPLPAELKCYAINDFRFLLQLWRALSRDLTPTGVELAYKWSTIEAEDTWRKEWMSSTKYVRAGFGECWAKDINIFQGSSSGDDEDI